MENKKEILNQFFEQAKENNLWLILDTFNLQTGDQRYTILQDYESLKLKQEYINENYNDDLEYEKCKCLKIEEFYLIDDISKGSDFLC